MMIHSILPGSIPPARAPYNLNMSQLSELKRQLTELECGFIRPNNSSYGAPVIFVRKRMVLYDCAWTIGHLTKSLLKGSTLY